MYNKGIFIQIVKLSSGPRSFSSASDHVAWHPIKTWNSSKNVADW